MLFFVHSVPLVGSESDFLRASSVEALGAVSSQVSYEIFDRLSLLKGIVVVAAKHLLESPLSPVVVTRVAGAHLAVPIVAETYLIELLAIAGNVFNGSHFGVLTGLNGILLSRQTIGIVAHRVKHIEALKTLIARIDVAGYVSERVTDVQAGSAGIRKHVENIEFWTRRIDRCLVDIVFSPIILPSLLDVFVIIFHRFEIM